MSDAEIWKPALGLAGRYSVSDWGRLRAEFAAPRKPTPRLMSNSPNTKAGYISVRLSLGNGRKVTRLLQHLVLEAFVGPRPPGLVCRHLDGDPGNNRLTNLRWGTQAENVADMIRHGRHRHGEDCSYARLSAAQVRTIRHIAATTTLSHAAIGKRFRVSRTAITLILLRTHWRHLEATGDDAKVRKRGSIAHHRGERHHRAKLTVDQVREIRRIGKTLPRSAIARHFQISDTQVGSILSGESWAHVTADGAVIARKVLRERRKLTPAEVLEIRALAAAGVTQRSIAAQFNLTKGSVFVIVHRQTWKHL